MQDSNLPDFQLPEPWNGDLINAPLLVISSNPSINREETYPVRGWADDKITDFFQNRFSGRWTQERRVLLSDGTYGKNKVKFWSEMHMQAERIFGREAKAGNDYAITEVVHCKSQREAGVKEALGECGEKWTRKIIERSGSRIIMVVGGLAKSWFCKCYGTDREKFFQYMLNGKKKRIVLFVPHPSSGKERRLDKILTPEQMQHLNSILS